MQKRIILYLAQHLPQTKSGVVRGIKSPKYKSSYKSSWFALNSLMEKGLIKQMGKVEARRTRYPTYWLTEHGIIYIALRAREGANWASLLERARETYPENERLRCLIEITPYTGTEALEMAYQTLLSKGRLEPSDYDRIIAIQWLKELTPEQFTELFAMLRKGYPEIYQQVKEILEQFAINLRRVLEMLP